MTVMDGSENGGVNLAEPGTISVGFHRGTLTPGEKGRGKGKGRKQYLSTAKDAVRVCSTQSSVSTP